MGFGINDELNIDLNECCSYYPFISSRAKRNRELLITLFEEEEFVVGLKEYWHFDYGNLGWAKGRPFYL